MARACRNPKCSVSTGICESLTFGSGRLSHNGYWEKPCAPCARASELKYPKDGECWPFIGQDVAELSRSIKEECDEDDKFFGTF
jgi:hypothetical protein